MSEIAAAKLTDAPPEDAKAPPPSNNDDSMNIILPNNNSGECTILVQIDPQDSSTLDFVGGTGAIGRMEADDTGVILDLKGCQYQGRLYPGATALVLSVAKNKKDEEQILKVDGITDEFCLLNKTGDALEMLNAVTKGDLHGSDSDFSDEQDTPQKESEEEATSTSAKQSSTKARKQSTNKGRKRSLSETKPKAKTTAVDTKKKRKTGASAKSSIGKK